MSTKYGMYGIIYYYEIYRDTTLNCRLPVLHYFSYCTTVRYRKSKKHSVYSNMGGVQQKIYSSISVMGQRFCGIESYPWRKLEVNNKVNKQGLAAGVLFYQCRFVVYCTSCNRARARDWYNNIVIKDDDEDSYFNEFDDIDLSSIDVSNLGDSSTSDGSESE